MNVNVANEEWHMKTTKGSISVNGAGVISGAQTVHNQATEGTRKSIGNKDVSRDGIVIEQLGNDRSRFSFSDCGGGNLIAAEEKNKAGSLVMLVTGTDCRNLDREGGLSEHSTKEQIEAMLEQMKEKRQWEEEMFDRRVEHHSESRKDFEIANMAARLEGAEAGQVAELLVNADIPATQTNIVRFMTAAEMAAAIPQMSDSAMAYLIGNQMEPTVASIYQAQYSGAGTKETAVFDEGAWQQVTDQVEKVITQAGREVTDEVMQEAKWLFSYDLPIVEENFQACELLQYLREEMPEEDLKEQLLWGMRQGMSPENAPLDRRYEKAKASAKTFTKELEQFGSQLDHQWENESGEDMDITTITARRQLEEIRLRMSIPAAAAMYEKGIRVELGSLQEIVDELRSREEAYYGKLLAVEADSADASVNSQNLQVMGDTLNKLYEIGRAPVDVLAVTLPGRDIMTVSTLHEEAINVQTRLEQAGVRYETMMTQVRSDLGDSLDKAFAGMDSLMEELAIEDTEDNRRAIRILARNHMELSGENLENVKEYDSRVRSIITAMRPQVVAELVKQGYNPLDMKLDELNQLLNRLQREVSGDDTDKYARYLIKLEHNQDITPEERNGYIGIYRLLHQIEKGDCQAIGFVVGAGEEVTLGNLLTAVRSRKVMGADYRVDDDFGALEKLNRLSPTITEQIEGNVHTPKISYEEDVFRQVARDISPEAIHWLQNGLEEGWQDLMRMPLEELKEKLIQYDAGHKEQVPKGEEVYYEQMAEKLRDMGEHQEEIVGILQNMGLSFTLENGLAVLGRLKGSYPVRDSLNRSRTSESNQIQGEEYTENDSASAAATDTGEPFIHNLLDAMEEPEKFQEQYGQLMEKMEKEISLAMTKPDMTYMGLEKLRDMQRGIHLQGAMSRQEMYEIPFVTETGVASMLLTLVKDQDNAGSVQIQFDTETLGKINLQLKLKDNQVFGYAVCGHRNGYETLRGASLEDDLQKAGFAVGKIYYTLDEKAVSPWENGGTKQEGKELYRLAKLVVSNLVTLDQKAEQQEQLVQAE